MEVVNKYREEHIAPLLEEYGEEDTYNLDELGLFYQALPENTMALKGEKCCDGKFSKQRISVLVGSNLSGINLDFIKTSDNL